jgi:hypothetical protein
LTSFRKPFQTPSTHRPQRYSRHHRILPPRRLQLRRRRRIHRVHQLYETNVTITVDLTANFTLRISADRTTADAEAANADLDYPVEASAGRPARSTLPALERDRSSRYASGSTILSRPRTSLLRTFSLLFHSPMVRLPRPRSFPAVPTP